MVSVLACPLPTAERFCPEEERRVARFSAPDSLFSAFDNLNPSASFPKDSRLLGSKDYAAVFDQVTLRISGRFFLFLINSDHPGSRARVGIVAAKKHAKLAVQRNRLKRLVRESFRVRKLALPTVNVVVLIKHGASEQDNDTLRKELDYLWNKLRSKMREPIASSA
jgi:ribonuclease P protein component